MIAPNARVARWAARPIASLQPESPLRPIVLGPEQIPLITRREDAARFAELAMVSALVHAHEARGEDAMVAALDAARRLDVERAGTYADLLEAVHRRLLHRYGKLMPLFDYVYQGPTAKRLYGNGMKDGVAKGVAKGTRSSLLAVIRARSLRISAAGRARIKDCTDVDLLRWLVRAVVAEREADIW
ncbi:MAG: hypothetical protein KIT84_29915 [Labilithrix sp.]|nr:hypothetical protein [Labilithrix sp.]MCW5815281.1 hypothetical protein [Labilithrix sp.]